LPRERHRPPALSPADIGDSGGHRDSQQETVFHLSPTSEREADRQNRVVIGGMKVSRSDLVPPADRETHSLPKVKPPDDQTRGHKVLFHAIMGALLKKRRIELDLGPEFATNPVLEGIVPSVGATYKIRVGDG